jgi:YHS domain-containing protein
MAQIVYDVVCGMSTELGGWSEQAEHLGKTFYFCSEGCKADFQRTPQRFLTKFAAEHPDLQPTPDGAHN